MKIDKTVYKETLYVAIGTFGLSALILVIYSAVFKFDVKALYGAIFGSVAAIINFFFMAYTLQKAVEINSVEIIPEKEDEDEEEKNQREKHNEEVNQKVKMKVKGQYAIRNMVYLLSLVVAVLIDVFNIFMLVIPAIFPSLVARVRMFWLNRHGEE